MKLLLNDMIFSYEKLNTFFERLKQKGPVIPLKDWDLKDVVTLLRHDIDLDVDNAYNLFKIEVDAGVRSTFLFLTSCYTYNILSENNRKKIREISDQGFEVGLHFDPLLYSDHENLSKKVFFEAGIIEEITGKPVKTISLHNPSIHGKYPVFENYINAYTAPYFNPDDYISDSRLGFRGKDPFNFIENKRNVTTQVLLHPLHFSKHERDYKNILKDYYSNHFQYTDSQFRQNNNVYDSQVPPNLI